MELLLRIALKFLDWLVLLFAIEKFCDDSLNYLQLKFAVVINVCCWQLCF